MLCELAVEMDVELENQNGNYFNKPSAHPYVSIV